MQKLQVFVAQANGQRLLGLTRDPRYLADLVGDNEKNPMVLTKPQISSQAYASLERWKSRLQGKLGFLWWHFLSWHSLQPGVGAEFSNIKDSSELEGVLGAITSVLRGRILSERQLITTLRQGGVWPSDISRALDLGVYRSELLQFPGFQRGPWGSLVCTRCRSENSALRPCVNCGRQDCLFCLGCANMGGNRGCSTLLTMATPSLPEGASPVQLELTFALTKAQEGAATELVEFWQGSQKRALVWAACGAGKTEVTFPLIQRALSEGKQVLFAIPRQDIVREMLERLQGAFPQVNVAVHYGGQPWLAPGNLVVATTHQVLHFYQRFQLVILDEVDAFPYQGNEMLRFGLLRSLTPGGKLVEMTATPQSLGQYERVITIPARYHGYPLPEPQFVLEALPIWDDLRPQDLPDTIVDLLQREDHAWLVFAPTIAACAKLQRVLASALGREVGLCHSQEPNRVQTIQRLRDGDLAVVVTTSVLERGVNFPQVGVVVLYADHGVFSTSALVQIAGRVGRTAQFPTGQVFFVATRRTTNMNQALRLIRHLNQEASTKGLLCHEAFR